MTLVQTGTEQFRVVYDGKDRSAFLHARRSGVGASDVAAVLGFSKFRTPHDVWLAKTGRKADSATGQHIEFGVALEHVVANRFSVRHGHRHGKHGRPIGKVHPSPGVLQSVHFPWLLATPDRLVAEFAEPGWVAPLEIKTAGAWVAGEWANGAVPMYYAAQSQAQQLVYYGPSPEAGAHGWIVPLLGGNDMPEPSRQDFDEEFAEYLITNVEAWWIRHVEQDIEPPLTLQDDVAALYPPLRGKSVVASPEILALVEERKHLSAKMSADRKRDEEIKAEIRLAMLDATVLTDDGGKVLVGWDKPMRAPGREKVVDLDRLIAEHPEIAAEYVTEREKAQSRTMTFK